MDVAVFQELGPEQAEAVAAVMPYGVLEPSRDCFGMGIALRHPGDVRHLALPHRRGRVVVLSPGAWPGLGAEVEVINAHVPAPHVWPPWRSIRWRREHLQALERFLDASPERPRVLLGDLNATPVWGVYRRLGARLCDAAALDARRRGSRPAATWGPWPSGPRLLRIDHALVHALGVEAVEVRRIPGSDHSALLADLVTS